MVKIKAYANKEKGNPRQQNSRPNIPDSEISDGKNRLSTSESIYQKLIENSLTGVFINQNGKYTFVNNEFARIHEYQPGELVGIDVLELIHPDDRETIKNITQVNPKGKVAPNRYEVRRLKKDGTTIWCEMVITSIEYQGKPAIMGNILDITRRKLAEAALKESEEFNSSLLANSPNPILVHNPDTSIIYANRAFEELTCFSAKDIVGQEAPHKWWTNETGCKTKLDLQNILTKRKTSIEEVFQTKDGKNILVEINSRPIKIKGEIKYLLSNWVDIMARKQSEKALRDSESFNSSLLNNSPNPILVINPDTSIKYVSPSLEELTGFTSKELIGKKIPYPWWPEENTQQHLNEFITFFHKGEGTVEKVFHKKNGERFWAHVSLIPIKESSEIKYHLSNWVDITERKKTEDRLAKLNEELRNLSAHLETIRESERERISREIHDELGQALASLKMDVCWLTDNLGHKQEPLRELTVSMAKRIDVTVQTVKRICMDLRPKLLDDIGLGGTVEWLTQEFEEATQIKCNVKCRLDEELLDSNRTTTIFRILQEALTNIYRHSNATKVSITLKKYRNKVFLKVCDNGKGITQEQLCSPKSFGLIGIRERVHFLGGDVKIHGTSGIGTNLIIRIPLGNER
jgi:PAS domain S-box-containing protein